MRLGPTNLNGTLPASLSALKNLRFFEVESNHLHGPLPDLPYDKMSHRMYPQLQGSVRVSEQYDQPGPRVVS